MKTLSKSILTLAAAFALTAVTRGDDTFETAIQINPTDARNAAIDYWGDYDIYRVNIPVAGQFAVGTEGNTDTFGAVLDPQGNVLASNDDQSASNRNFGMSGQITPGVYYIFVRHYSQMAVGAYVLRTQFSGSGGAGPVNPPPGGGTPVPAGDDHGNTAATATRLNVTNGPASAQGNIETADDVDVFVITLPVDGRLTAISEGNTDMFGALFVSGTDQPIAWNGDMGNGDRNFGIQMDVPAGTYYLAALHQNPTGTGAYGIRAAFQSATGNPPPGPGTPPPGPGNPPPGPGNSPSPSTGNRALLIGISDYQSINDLQLCDDDVRDMGALLRESGWSVTTLIDAQASKASIQQHITNMVSGDGQFLIYYSGHGTAIRATGFICPWDTGDTAETLISESELKNWLKGAGKRTTVGIVLDSCHSGAFIGRNSSSGVTARFHPMPGTTASPRAGVAFARNVTGPRRVVLTGCRGSQVSMEVAQLGHGWLSYNLLQAFRDLKLDRNRNGAISLEESFRRVSRGYSADGSRQTPQLYDGNGARHFDVGRP